MKVLTFAPHGSLQKETGLMALVISYLGRVGAEVLQLQCNGCASVCGRDAATSWTRTITSCLKCHHEQRSLGKWMGARGKELGALLTPEDISQSHHWIQALGRDELLRAEFRGTNVYALCEATFTGRFEKSPPTFATEDEERVLRELMLSAVQISAATDKTLAAFTPEIALVSGLGDQIEEAFISRLRAKQLPHAIFRFDAEDGAVTIQYPLVNRVYSTRLVFDNIQRMRNDHRSWPAEIVSVVHEILGFLGYGEERVPLS